MENDQTPKVTRKQFLKLLAAAGGATAAAAFLPGKWIKPIVKVGVLPAHAQGSQNNVGLTIGGLGFVYNGTQQGNLGLGKGAGLASRARYSPEKQTTYYRFLGHFHFFDEGDNARQNNVTLYMEVDGNIILNNFPITGIPGTVHNTQNGTVDFSFYLSETIWGNSACSYEPGNELSMTISDSINIRTSNTISGTIQRPC
jgi:hypothetical protein